MSSTSSIFALFSVLVGILLFGIWSNTHVFAQQLPLSSPPAAGSSNSLSTPTISAELKSKICDPSNPSLKVVNTTEARICGIPKTVKPPLVSSSATPPPTSAVLSSSSPPQQTTKPTTTTAASITTTPKQQQQVATTTTNNNTNNNTVSRSTGAPTAATIAPVSNASNRSLSSPLPSSPIAPQVKAISQQQQQPQPVKAINSTAGQNYTFAATSPVVASGKLMYLGYHGSDGTPTNDDSSSKDKSSSSDTKPSTDHSVSSTTTDNDST
ncbi:MAG: hypothetical protein ACJ72J_16450, partial [Nitrososphaeraceae archaeon]